MAKISTTASMGTDNEVHPELYRIIKELIQSYCSKCTEFSCSGCSIDCIMHCLRVKEDKKNDTGKNHKETN